MEVVVILAVLVFAFIFIGSSVKAKARMNFADTHRANIGALKGVTSAPPSWKPDEARGEMFFQSIAMLCERRGIPRELVMGAIRDPELLDKMLGIAGGMERQGHSFVAQQGAVFEFLQTIWNAMNQTVRDKLIEDIKSALAEEK